MLNKMYFPAILHAETDGGYSIWLQDIKGCVSQGENLGEAIENIKDAIGILYEVALEENTELPKPTTPNNKEKLEDNETIAVIEFDPEEYLSKQSTRAVKKTLSIPAWLNAQAEQAGINFSQLLQTAIRNKLNI